MENRLQQTTETTREFKLQLLQHITNNFSEKHIIGRGGYGVVYKGVLEDGEEIAVKRLHHLPGLDDKEFRNEFNNLMRAQHKNIVRLIGYCYDIGHQRIKLNEEYIFAHLEERVLCLEYLEGGSLDNYVSDGSCGLDWHTCYAIIRGVCEGLNYLHNGSKDPIFHLDLKPANILLNKVMMPKIGDFGLSRLCPSAKTCTAIKIIGTPGYMPPEYIERCQITSKFDIFSLGVIIIQIMAGREGYFKLADITSQEFIKLVHENWLKRLHATVSSHTSHEVKRCIEIALKCVEFNRVVQKHRDLLVSMCDERARLLQDQFDVSMRHVHALAILISTFHHSKSPSTMDQTTFAKYVESMELSLMTGLVYAVRVTHAQREQFEHQQGWNIKKCSYKNSSLGPGDRTTMEISELAEEYAPVIFAHDACKNAISMDALSNIHDRENVVRATESGKGVLTPPFELLNNHIAVTLTYTLYKYDLPATARIEERRQAAVGYLGGIFGIEALLDKVLQQLVADKKSIVVNVYDTTNSRPIRMHCSNDTGSCSTCISHNSTLNFGDPSRRHEMHCRFTQRSPWPWLAITSSFGTLVTALQVGYKFYAVLNHIPKVESSFQNMAGIKKRA
ncbi:hypothetical protein ACQ4PT_057952 [Festuca glaucescens]